MASSWVGRNMFPILPLLIFLSMSPFSFSSFFSPSDKVTKDLLNHLCIQPPIPHHFCIAWLDSDPTTYTLDLKGLVDLVLQKTQLFAYKNLAMMKGLERLTTDPTLKAPYDNCVTYYELTIQAIEKAQGLASSKSYMLASQEASKAFDNVLVCEGRLQGRANEPAYVPQRSMLMKRMCTIDNVFSSVLAS